jgi:hypothetical protein
MQTPVKPFSFKRLICWDRDSHNRTMSRAIHEDMFSRTGLETHTPNNLLVGDPRLIFQEEVILKQKKARRNSKKIFTKMYENGDLKNRVAIEMDQLNFVVAKEPTEDIIDQEAKSMLEEGGKHDNLIRIGCWDVFPGGRTPLQHCAVPEKVIHDKLVDSILIHNGRLEKVRMLGGHSWGEGSQHHKVRASVKVGITGKLQKKWWRRKE